MNATPARRKILVIDDERGPRESLRMLLKPDYEVLCAESVEAGLALLQSAAPDLIVMDIRMPVRNGIDGLRDIRGRDTDIAVIMLTGYGDLDTAREAIRLGANDYLRKPFDTEEMLDVVRQNIARTDSNRQRRGDRQQLQELTRQLQEDLTARSRMAALGMASSELVHDIRNPLTIVMGYFDLLHEELSQAQVSGGSAPAGTMDYLDSIKKNLVRCTEIMETWRALGNKAALDLMPLNVAEFLADVVREAAGPNARVRPTLDVPGACRFDHVQADRVQLRRVLQNILDNALQAVSPGTGMVTVSLRRQDGQVVISVCDNGCGIPADKLPRVFDPFFTTKSAKKGTGLGLFIARQVVEDHGGDIRIESAPAAGTTVKVTLPRVC